MQIFSNQKIAKGESIYCRRYRISVSRVFIVILTLFSFSVNGFSQQDKQVVFGADNEQLYEIINKLSDISGVNIVYPTTEIKKYNHISFPKAIRTLQATLDLLLKGTTLDYKFLNGKIVIFKRTRLSKDSLDISETVIAENQKTGTGANDIAQKLTIKGKVLDEAGHPLAGISITLKSTKRGTFTDADGNFEIKGVGIGSTLVFSGINIISQERQITSTDDLVVSLKSNEKTQEDVVVVGYGTQAKSKVTGAISTISGKDLENIPSPSFESMLQGKAPGLLVLNNSGNPGQQSLLMIRGIGAISSSANSNVVSTPLFIIDGIPMIQQEPNLDPNSMKPLNSLLAGINPYDIESIEVLKDAASTAIYGSRAANGVIMITTKRGKVGKPIVNVNGQYGDSYYPELRPTLGGNAERALKIKLYNIYSNSDMDNGVPATLGVTQGMPVELTDSLNPFYNNSTDWQRLLFRNGIVKQANIAVSGGGVNNTYRLSADYYDEQGTVLGTGFKRYSLNYNGSYNPITGLNIMSQIQVSQTDQSRGKGTSTDEAVVGNQFLSSLYPAPNSGFFDSYIDAYKDRTDVNLVRNVQGNLQGTYDIFKFLNITSRVSANYSFAKRRTFNPARINTSGDGAGKPSASEYFSEDLNLVNENFITFNKTFASAHTVNAVIGNSVNTFSTESLQTYGINGPGDQTQVLQGYANTDITSSSSYYSYGLLSYYGRFTYDYKAKYILQLSARADGSSKFGANKKWGYFPTASIGWVFSKEKFVEDLAGNWLHFGKLRASIGKTGQQYNDYYLAVGQYLTGPTYNGVPTVSPNYEGDDGIPLPDLSWEKSTQYDFGADLELFNGRWTAQYDYYYKVTTNYLFPTPLPVTSGYNSTLLNAGKVANWGYELGTTVYIFSEKSPFQWNITLNASRNNNALISLPNDGRTVLRSPDGQVLNVSPSLVIGRPINGYFMYINQGVYKSTADVPINPFTGRRPAFYYFGSYESGYYNPYQGGDAIFKDINNNGQIDQGDRVYMGSPNPKVYGGIYHEFRYQKNQESGYFTLRLQFNYVLGRKIYNDGLRQRLLGVTWGNGVYPFNYSTDYTIGHDQLGVPDVSAYNIWWPDHTDAKYPALNPWRSQFDMPNIGYNVDNYGDRYNSAFLENGDFIRLKTLSFSYDLGRKVLSKLKLRRLSVFCSMDNVFLIQGYDGVDAENVDEYGYDRGNGYPIPKKITFGLNLEF